MSEVKKTVLCNCDENSNSNSNYNIKEDKLENTKHKNLLSPISNSSLLIKTSEIPIDMSNNKNNYSYRISNIQSIIEEQSENLNNDKIEKNNFCLSLKNSDFDLIIKKDEYFVEKLYDEENLQSVLQLVDNESLYENQNDNTFKTIEKMNINVIENNCQHLNASSISESTNKIVLSVNDKVDDINNSCNNFKSSIIRSVIPQNKNKNLFKCNQSDKIDLTEDNSSCLFIMNAPPNYVKKNSQLIINTTQSHGKYLNKHSLSEKHSENKTNFKRSLSINCNLTSNNESQAGTVSSTSISTIDNILFMIDKSDDESNSRTSFKLSENDSVPESHSVKQANLSKNYFNISGYKEEIIDNPILKINTKYDDKNISSTSKFTKSVKQLKSKTKRGLFDSNYNNEITATLKIDKNLEFDIEKNTNRIDDPKLANKFYKINSLVNSDSESDNNYSKSGSYNSIDEENHTQSPKKGKIKSEKRMESVRVSKEQAMQKIHSETQRLIRESEISLPYHRPKQRSLQEFLNRKKMMSEIPTHLTCAEKVKMFPEIISKVVEEKEKEAEIFYKSSDSEEDEKCIELKEFNQVNVLNDVKNKSEIKNKDKSDNKISIANTQKLTQYGIQESHIKGEIVVQQSLHFGASKKIIMDDMKNTKESKSDQDNLKYLSENENLISNTLAILKKKCKKINKEPKKYIISGEFFTNNSENIDISIDSNQCILDENVIDNQKPIKNDEKKNPSKKVIIENNSEDIVLNISETEIENNENEKVIELSTVNDLSFQSKNQETILETSIINNKTNTISRISVNVKGVEQETVNFNQSKQISETNLKSNEQKNCNVEIVDHDDTDFSLGLKVNESSKKSNMKEKILANVLKLKPIIKGSPGSIIDFTGSKHMNEGVAQLLNRFAQHSIIVKPKIEGVTKVKIMNTERKDNNTKIKEETLLFKKTVVENEDDNEHKPGEKLKKLREDLKRRIAYVRHEEWKKKEEDEKEDEEIKDESDSYYAGLPDEEELLEDDESSESEPEENDVLIIDNQKSICEFADEEAEESDHEYIGNSENEKDIEKEQEAEVEVDDHDKELKENEDDENLESEDEKFTNKPTKLKRIIKSFEDDSNQLESSLSNDTNSRLSFDRTKTDEDMFASQTSNSYASEDIDGIPPFQPRDRCSSDSRSQACKTPLPKPNNILSMISPVAQLTVLNASLDSAKKSASKTDSINFGLVDKSCLVINTSAKNSNLEKMIGLPKKLFDDPPETVNDDELVDICSGKFIETQNSERVINERNGVTDTQLMELCSGAFISQPVDMKKLEFKYANSNIKPSDDTSQDITLTFDDEDNDNFMDSSMKMSSSMKRSDESMFSNDSKSPIKACTYSSNTSKSPMETWLKRANENMATIYTQQQKQNEVTDSQLIGVCSGVFMSQPIDMKELEQNDTLQIQSRILQDFKLTLSDKSKSLNKESNETNMNKKKLESLQQQIIANEKEETAPWSTYMIVSSDDDNLKKYKESCMKTKKKALKKRKKVQKLILSDDEENKSNEFSEDEEDQTIDEEDQKYIEYDSDENEIVVVNKKEIKKVAANFLEKEAELSESDWDSADEDEQDMDKFEYEEGDMEKIDENKMKKLLDKIHIKQMMDRDQSEVKILQEFLFDDGDLHNDGISRERRFKWKNIDNFDDNLIPIVNDDDEIDDDVDAAVEAQMRKIRYEQQKFLEEKEKKINQNAEKDFEVSHSCKLGLKVISVRSSRKSSLKNHGVKGINLNTNQNFLLHGVSNISSKISTKFKNSAVSNIRGSFLSRGEETLVRIAQNLPETNKKIINPLRNRKFVFEHVSPSVSNVLQEDLEQKNDTTLIKEKKKIRKRKMFSSQTPKTTKKLKFDDRTSCKQLF